MAYIGKQPVIGNFQKCDAIAVVNGQAAYTLQVGGSNVSPQSENHMLVSLNGILQSPTDSFTVSGSTITFASALSTGDVIDFVMILGNVLDLGVPSDNTVTTAKLADSSVTAAKITDATITAAKLASGAVQNQSAFKNIIINGDMSIAQRGTSTASITSTGYNTVDRFQTVASSLGTWTQSQSTDVPTGQGFAKSLKMECTTADASPAASDELRIRHNVEAQFLQYLKKGTSNAESLTLSFWVKSNKTGSYIAELMDNDNSYRHIGKSYTIDTADTWEKKTITFAGDTTGGNFDNNNGAGLGVSFWLSAGSNYTSGTLQTSWGSLAQTNRAVGQVNLADNTSNYINITGVQLEAGTSASDFEFLPYDVNLQRCQRYYIKFNNSGTQGEIGVAYSSSAASSVYRFPVPMRASPTQTYGSGSDYYRFYRLSSYDTITTLTNNGQSIYSLGVTYAVSTTAGVGGELSVRNADGIQADAEL